MSKKYVLAFDVISIKIPTIEPLIYIYNRKNGDTCKYFESESSNLNKTCEDMYKILIETSEDIRKAIRELQERQNKIAEVLTNGATFKELKQ